MQDEEVIVQLQILIEQLSQENELLTERINELEARLAKYEDPHTPPSLRRGRNCPKGKNEVERGKPGQKIGHKGITRPRVTPDKQVEVIAYRCPDCGTELGNPIGIDSKVIEEIPEPPPVLVTEFRIAQSQAKELLLNRIENIKRPLL